MVLLLGHYSVYTNPLQTSNTLKVAFFPSGLQVLHVYRRTTLLSYSQGTFLLGAGPSGGGSRPHAAFHLLSCSPNASLSPAMPQSTQGRRS
jgi:hypothetical protein